MPARASAATMKDLERVHEFAFKALNRFRPPKPEPISFLAARLERFEITRCRCRM